MPYYYEDDRGRRMNLNVNLDSRGRSRSRSRRRSSDAPAAPNIYINPAQASPPMPGGWQQAPWPGTQGQGQGQFWPHAGGNGGGNYGGGPQPVYRQSPSPERHDSPEFVAWRNEKAKEEFIADFKRQQEAEKEKVKEALVAQRLKDEKDKAEKKAAEKAAIAKWQEDERQAKEERKRIAEEWEREQKEKQEKEDREYKDRMAKDLAKFGFKDNQVDAIVNHKEANESALVAGGAPLPSLPKVNVAYLEERTLKKSKLPYHRDQFDPNMWCIDTPVSDEILQSMFAHTTEIRRKRDEERKHHLASEDKKEHRGRKKDDNKFIQIKTADKSRSRSRQRDKSPGRGKSPARGNDMTGPEKLVERLFLR